MAEAVPEQRADDDRSRELREQEAEFYQDVVAVLADMPFGTPVPEALASEAGQRVRLKWSLKYGRRPPL